MDSTISQEQIAEALKNLDRRKQHENATRTNADSLAITSAIGTDTPLTVLMDIRQTMSEILDTTRQMAEITRECVETSFKSHRETLAYMQQITDAVNMQRNATRGLLSPIPSSSRPSASVERSDVYYYRGDAIKRSESVIACIFLHLDNMISKVSPSEIGGVDTTVMELKEWSAAVKILKDAESTITENKGKLKIPMLSTHECKYALDIVASPIQGRVVSCKVEHITELLDNCPTLINCVEEIRVRSLECPGIVSISRQKRLASISFPYVNAQGSLNITDASGRAPGSKVVFDRVRLMKEPQKKLYVNAILRDHMRPMNACTRAMEHHNEET